MSRRRVVPVVALVLAAVLAPLEAHGARQPVALFALEIAGRGEPAALALRLGEGIREKLQDRFDVRPAGEAGPPDDSAGRARKARALGAVYLVTGSVARIGRAVTLDLTIAPVEDPAKGRSVVVTGAEGERAAEPARPGVPDNGAVGGGELPFVYRRLVIEGTAKLKLAFFGDDVVGLGAARRKIPRPAGTLTRSRNAAGEVVSVAWGDTDRDGRKELVAAFPDAIGVYRVEEDDLVLRETIALSGPGVVHVDAADVDRNGVAEIVAVRYAAGRASSEIWEHDGKAYRRRSPEIPYFLRAVDLGDEGVVLVGQEADAGTVFRGPVFRYSSNVPVAAGTEPPPAPLPLPEGTGVYSFVPLRSGGERRFAVLREDGRLVLLDPLGRALSATPEAVTGRETALEPAAPPAPGTNPPAPRRLPGRLFAVDLDGDRIDEVVATNNLLAAGGFFENIRVFADAEVLAFAQDGETLRLAWRTALVGGAARDAFIDAAGGGKAFRIGIASRDRGKILGRFGEWRLLWVR